MKGSATKSLTITIGSCLLCRETLSLSNAASLFCAILCLTFGDRARLRDDVSCNLFWIDNFRFSNATSRFRSIWFLKLKDGPLLLVCTSTFNPETNSWCTRDP